MYNEKDNEDVITISEYNTEIKTYKYPWNVRNQVTVTPNTVYHWQIYTLSSNRYSQYVPFTL